MTQEGRKTKRKDAKKEKPQEIAKAQNTTDNRNDDEPVKP